MLSDADIVEMVTKMTRRFTDVAPTGHRYVTGTRHELSSFIARHIVDGPDGQRQAVLVEAEGDFTWIHSAPPPIKGPPHNKTTGTAIYLIIDLETGQQQDWGILKQPIDLSPLGQVFTPAAPS
jgi:hypothetical protein